jgi:hypothetical protein
MTVQDWPAVVAALVTGLAGVTAMLRFLIKHYLSELKPNGGSSVKDQVNRLEARVDDIYRILCERSIK